MTRWTHMHTFVCGSLAALALSHGWLLAGALLVVFVLGIVLGRVWRGVHAARVAAARAVVRAGERVEELHHVRLSTEKARGTELRTRTRHRARPRRLQDAEVKRAYVSGATDQARRDWSVKA